MSFPQRVLDPAGRLVGTMGKPSRPSRSTVGTTSAEVLADNPRRTKAVVQADKDNTENIHVAFGGPAVVNYGVALPPGGAWEIDASWLWLGSVEAISASGSQYIHTEEWEV